MNTSTINDLLVAHGIKPTDDGSEEPRLNASFLMGKRWVLDYEHRQLLILPE